MGLLALLAYKAMKGGSICGSATSGAPQPQTPVGPAASHPEVGGGASDWLGGLGKLIAGGGAGSILTGGLSELIKKFQQTGQGKVAQSWVGTGPNQSVASGDLEKAIGFDTLDALSQQTGMARNQVLNELTEKLPITVDSLTPQGRLPSENEVSRWA